MLLDLQFYRSSFINMRTQRAKELLSFMLQIQDYNITQGRVANQK